MLRRNIIIIFMCLELMLNAANLSLVAFSPLQRRRRRPAQLQRAGARVLHHHRRRRRSRRRPGHHRRPLPRAADDARRGHQLAEVLSCTWTSRISPGSSFSLRCVSAGADPCCFTRKSRGAQRRHLRRRRRASASSQLRWHLRFRRRRDGPQLEVPWLDFGPALPRADRPASSTTSARSCCSSSPASARSSISTRSVYMERRRGRRRASSANLSLFMFSMLGIVLANNFAMMFIFWELVGVVSYLLIGHWFTRDSAARRGEQGVHHQPPRRLRFHARHPDGLGARPAR